MNNRLAAVFFLLLLGATGFLWYRYDGNIDQLVKDFRRGTNAVPLLRSINTPAPLRGPLTGEPVVLTADGVFQYTNEERVVDGKKALIRNSTLDKAAMNKVDDMFTQEYFEHESPDGRGPGDVVDAVQYEFITVGENLALGNFESDQALVEAWMNSPGHRANILGEQYTEIGIAVKEGEYEGTRTWLAVQTFATPTTACKQPDSALGQQIETQRPILDAKSAALSQESESLSRLAKEIQTLQETADRKMKEGNAEIQEGNRISKETGDNEEAQKHWDKGEQLHSEAKLLYAKTEALISEYESKESTYNQRVRTYETESDAFSEVIDTYNQQVQATNACINQFAG